MSVFKFGIFFLIVIILHPTNSYQQPLDYLKNAYNWFSNKISDWNNDKSSLTINIENIDKLGHLKIEVSNTITVDSQKTNDIEKRTNLLELAKSLNLTTLVEKAIAAGIEDVLDHEGPFTLFAPTNEAFLRRPKFCDNVPSKDLMKYHVGKGSVKLSSFKNDLLIPSLLTRRGVRINLYKNNKVITSNGRLITKPDNVASNGILHIIDNVMCAVYKGSLAFEINRCPALSLLSKAINITDLYSVLDGSSLATVFAPTDAAFKKIPPEILDALLKNVTALKQVLLYHVVPDILNSAGLENGQKLKTAQGQSVLISISDKIMVNNAVVTLADATVSNGVVHSIDNVLFPKMLPSFLKTFGSFNL